MTSTISYQTKFCTKCNTEHPIVNFHKNKSKKDGLATQCSACYKTWREENKEQVKATKQAWNNANKSREANRKKLWAESNKKHKAATDKAWQQSNPEKVNAKCAKRRAAKLHATPSWSETIIIQELYNESAKKTKETGIEHNVDHIVPLQSDIVCGLHCLANLRVITAVENRSKNNLHWPDMP